MLLALTHGIVHGAKKSLASAMGNVTVTLLQAIVSIVGLGAVLLASELIFQLVKWAGAAYLIYMGISMLRSSNILEVSTQSNSEQRISLVKIFSQSALVTAGNPKAIIFFTAVFPQFIDPQQAYVLQSFVLMSICAVVTFVCFMAYALAGQKIMPFFAKANVWKYVKRTIGGSFIGSGIGLALANK